VADLEPQDEFDRFLVLTPLGCVPKDELERKRAEEKARKG
jgi:hypothetical protein